MKARFPLALVGVLLSGAALAQSVPLQGGPWTPGHTLMYAPSNGGTQPMLLDAGPAVGGGPSAGLGELLLQARGLGTAPYANAGTGPLGANHCDYDGPATGAAHYLCFSANAQGGGLIAYGTVHGASPLPLFISANGAIGTFGNVQGNGASTAGHVATFSTTSGTVIQDGGYVAANKAGDTFTGPIIARHQNVLTGAVARSTAPSSAGNWNSISTAFTGDLSTVSNAIAHSITGATTLTQPATGYYYQNEAFPNLVYLFNSSGWNQSTSTNDGRTAAVAYRTKVDNYGQGDAVAYNCSTFVTGTRAGSTDFLANPAVSCINGDSQAGADGTYLNPGEWMMTDGGFDVSGVGWVTNLYRSNDTGAKNAYWAGFRSQSIGSKSVDAHFSATGKARTGLDFSGVTFDPSGTWTQAAVVLPQSARIYGNGVYGAGGKYTNTSTGTDWIERSQFGFWNFVFNNTSALQVADTQVTALPLLQANNGVNVSAGKSYQINGTNILAFTQLGTGAVARTVDAKLKNGVFSVLDFGAACDGSTNDTAAIRLAITAIQANGGGFLDFPYKGGLCQVNTASGGPLTLSGDVAVTLRGIGDGGIKNNATDGSNTIYVGGAGPGTHQALVQLQNLKVWGSTLNGSGVYVSFATNTQIIGSSFYQNGQMGVFGDNSYSIVIDHNTMSANGVAGVYLQNAGGNASRITHNIISGHTGVNHAGIAFGGTTNYNIQIMNNSIELNYWGIHGDNVQGLTIIGNYMENNAGSNTEINLTSATVKGVTIIGNTLFGYAGINSADGVVVTGNTFTGSGPVLDGTSSTNTFVAGNIFTNAGTVANVARTGLSAKTAVASLPTCNAGAEGSLYSVTDANSTTFNAAVAGGGANHVMAYCNGTGWTVH